MIEEIIVNGIIFGSIYGLLALGFELIYGVSGIVNLTHGAFFMIGTYIFAFAFKALAPSIPAEFSDLTAVLAVITTVILMGIIGSVFYRLMLHKIVGDQVALLVVSICGGLMFQQIVFMGFGTLFVSVPSLTGGITTIWNVEVLNGVLLGAVISWLLFIVIWLFIARTKNGRAMKALSQDREAAMLMGINRERTYMLTAAISAALAGIAGILIVSSTTGQARADIWLQPLVLSFAIVVLGGLGSIKGTIIGGLIFGFAEKIVAYAFPMGGSLVPATPFIILLFVLVVRPKGIFGKRVEMEE
jgi:branched-chain amino acid transport system permease protein